jgi:hypothetical protein
MFRDLHSRITLYLFLTILGVLLVNILTIIVITNRLDENLLTDNLLKESELLELTIQHPLTLNDFSLVDKIFINVGLRRDIRSARIISPQGKVLASSVPDEIGAQLSNAEQVCQGCHKSGLGAAPKFVRTLDNEDTFELIITANSLDNTVACFNCHQDERESLGVLIIENRVRGNSLWAGVLPAELLLSSLTIVVVLLLATTFIFQKAVSKPLFALMNGTDLDSFSKTSDVIGLIAQKLQNNNTQLVALQEDSSLIALQ